MTNYYLVYYCVIIYRFDVSESKNVKKKPVFEVSNGIGNGDIKEQYTIR